MSKPVYEIPVTNGLRDVPPAAPPGHPASSESPLASAPPPQFPAPATPPPTSAAPTAAQPVQPPPAPQPAQQSPLHSAPPPQAAPPSAAAHASPQPQSGPAQPGPAQSAPAQSGPRADPDLLLALQAVLDQGASDLHVTIDAPPMLRVDGTLRPIEGAPPWVRSKVELALHSILTDAQLDRFERELELDFAFTLSAEARFRVNFYQQRNAIGGAFRIIPTQISTLEQLGLPEAVGRFSTLPRGLVLVTGPTGSGKSTTLAALIDLVNRTRADHIMTVEDPIEFIHRNQRSLVNQREVGHDTHSFGAALKHVLRQDPDVILIGEMRDHETISIALTAAETGHLVFGTLHTQDAPQTIDRIIDVFPPHQQPQIRTQLAATLQGVVSQTLVKHASGQGRVVAAEIMMTTPAVANLIREGKTYQVPTIMQAGRGLGMQTMDQHLAELVNSGKVTMADAAAKVHDTDTFTRLVHRDTGFGGGMGATRP